MNVDYHLLKRKNTKGKTIYYVAFLSDVAGKNNKKKYKAVKSTGMGNRSAAEKVARQMLQDGSVLASRDSLRSYLINFWNPEKSEYLKSQKAEGRNHNSVYIKNNLQRIEQYILPYFESRSIKKLSDLTRKNIFEWRNYLFEHGCIPEYVPDETKTRGYRKRTGTISPATQNKVRQAFFVALQFAVEMGMLPYNPGQGIKRVKEEKHEREIFQLSELKLMFSAPWENKISYTACLLAVTTGARLGEVRGLQVKNVNLDTGSIDIVTNYVPVDGLKNPKWDSIRMAVTLPDSTIKALKVIIESSPFSADPDSFVFYTPTNRNIPCDIKIITNPLKVIMKELNITGKTFHCFRHTYVSHLRGVLPDSKVQNLIGHTNTATTNDYTHTTDEDQKIVKNAIESFIK